MAQYYEILRAMGRTSLIGIIAIAVAIALTRAATTAAAVWPAPVPLWPRGDMPGARGVSNANTPAVYPFLPSPRNRTGAAVLVVPGALTKSTIEVEGAEVAAWLNSRGVAAFVLRYRPTARDQRDAPVADVNRAVQYIRARAAEFRIGATRVGLLGFASGAALGADAVYNHGVDGDADSKDPVARASSRPDFLGLIYGSAPLGPTAANAPPTFLVASSRATDHQDEAIDLWTKLRAARVPVDAHFFAKTDATAGLAKNDPAVGAWPAAFYNWIRYRGWLTDQPRVAIRGMALLDGRPLPHGYVILTPLDAVGAGPIVARVINSTAGIPIGQFSVPANQGPVPGRYRVEVHQNANRWLSNAFTSTLITDSAFGHSRLLSPSIDDHQVYGKAHPTERNDYIIEIKPDGDSEMKIEVFSQTPAAPGVPKAITAVSNPGIAAYNEQLKYAPAAVPGIPAPTLLWPDGAPDAVPDANGVLTDEDTPAIYAFPAPAAGNTGAALLVLPGGAFTNRAIDQEGIQIARWLNRHGIGGFVLRYRIRPNYSGQISMLDAYRAMRYIRWHAAEYRIDVNRVGTIGFSAGAELEGDAFFNKVLPGDAAAADPLDRISARSNFNVLIYGGRNLVTPAEAPPTFMFVTLEDGGNHLAPEINVLNGLRASGIPVEAHWYQDGPHGTSLSPGDPQLGQWPELMLNWLRTLSLIKG